MLLDVDKVAGGGCPRPTRGAAESAAGISMGAGHTLRAAGRADEAAKVEADLKQFGAQSDPRTFALFLATRGEQAESAVQLAQRELQDRADIFTHDALAWALAAAGRDDQAWPHMEKALAEDAVDARLFTHAGVLAARLGRTAEAESWLASAQVYSARCSPQRQQLLQRWPPWRRRATLDPSIPPEHKRLPLTKTNSRKPQP